MNTAVSVASLASAAAVASPSIVSAAGNDCTFPDLAKRLAAVRERWIDRQIRDAEGQRRFDDAVRAATGRELEPHHSDRSLEAEAYRRISDQIANDLSPDEPRDAHGCALEWVEIHDETYAVFDKIMACRPKSVTDLGLIGQAFALKYSEYWTDGEDDAARKLVECVCAFAGTVAIPGADLDLFKIYGGRPTEDAPVSNAKPLQDDPVFAAIEAHKKAEARLSPMIDEKAKIDVLSEFGKAHTAETRRQERNVDRRIARAHDREISAFESLLSTQPESDVGKAHLIAYLRTVTDGRGGLQPDEVATLLENVQAMVTPPWLMRMAEVQLAKSEAALATA